VEFYNRINIWVIGASGWLFKKKSITMHDNMNVKFSLVLFASRSGRNTRENTRLKVHIVVHFMRLKYCSYFAQRVFFVISSLPSQLTSYVK
jgi:hypothetical protein